MTSYSIDVLKRSAFQDELTNILASDKTKIKIGGMMHSYVVSYLTNRIKEIDNTHSSLERG